MEVVTTSVTTWQDAPSRFVRKKSHTPSHTDRRAVGWRVDLDRPPGKATRVPPVLVCSATMGNESWLVRALESSFASLPFVAILGYLLKTWLERRLTAAVQHEYDQKLETHKAELGREHEQLRAAMEQARALYQAAAGGFASGHEAGFAR